MHVIIWLFLIVFPHHALAGTKCDVFSKPENCLGKKVELLDLQQFSKLDRNGVSLYISDSSENVLGLTVWVTLSKGRVHRIRYARTTARSVMPSHEFKSLQLGVQKGNSDSEWRTMTTRDGEARIYESNELKIILSRYSISFEALDIPTER